MHRLAPQLRSCNVCSNCIRTRGRQLMRTCRAASIQRDSWPRARSGGAGGPDLQGLALPALRVTEVQLRKCSRPTVT